MWSIRPADSSDLASLERALYEAAFWRGGQPRPDPGRALTDPPLSRYVRDWGREGDAAVIAEAPEGETIGAAWYRLLGAEERGYGFVDGATPEITVAVLPAHRRQGVGRALLAALMEHARTAGFQSVSLSVEPANPALRLYERLGFTWVAVVDGSWTMRADLRAGHPADASRRPGPRPPGTSLPVVDGGR